MVHGCIVAAEELAAEVHHGALSALQALQLCSFETCLIFVNFAVLRSTSKIGRFSKFGTSQRSHKSRPRTTNKCGAMMKQILKAK